MVGGKSHPRMRDVATGSQLVVDVYKMYRWDATIHIDLYLGIFTKPGTIDQSKGSVSSRHKVCINHSLYILCLWENSAYFHYAINIKR